MPPEVPPVSRWPNGAVDRGCACVRNWKNWLPPVLTALTVACLTVLPLRLSGLRDGKLIGTVHAEELGADSNFPARPPELPGRVWLLAERNERPDRLTIVDQQLEGEELDLAFEQVYEELRQLEEAGVLPPVSAWEEFDRVTGNRVYLRDQTDLSSAAFWELNVYWKETGEYMWLYLDKETGRVLALMSWFYGETADPETMGRRFLDRLGLKYEMMEQLDTSALFRLTESSVLYDFVREGFFFQIQPIVDWDRADQEALSDVVYGTWS